jgi:cytochrome P450
MTLLVYLFFHLLSFILEVFLTFCHQTNISFNQWSAYRSPKNFTQPNEFLPERWLQSEKGSRFDMDKKATLQPFSFGPRNCIGKNLAYAELRLILARMIWNFDLSLSNASKSDQDTWVEQRNYVLVEKMPLKVQLALVG